MKAKKRSILSLTDVLTFGKHKGKTVASVMDRDPNWLHWAIDNVLYFELSREAMKQLPEQEYDDDYARAVYDAYLSDVGDR